MLKTYNRSENDFQAQRDTSSNTRVSLRKIYWNFFHFIPLYFEYISLTQSSCYWHPRRVHNTGALCAYARELTRANLHARSCAPHRPQSGMKEPHAARTHAMRMTIDYSFRFVVLMFVLQIGAGLCCSKDDDGVSITSLFRHSHKHA